MVCFIIKAIFSVYAFLNFMYFFMHVIYGKIIVKFIRKPIDLRKTGEWAVVTGCTDGIGKEFAIELAKIGMNVVLVSRTKSKLEDLADQISTNYNVKTRIVVANFTNSDSARENVEKGVQDLDVGVLVNNVGMKLEVTTFLNQKKEDVNDLLEVNMWSVPKMCYIVLPKMLQKKKGVIINISSTTGIIDSPEMAVYGATKAFIAKFSKDLQIECKNHGVYVQCFVTGFVATKMLNMPPSMFVATPNSYVKSALKWVGVNSFVAGYPFQDLMVDLSNGLSHISPALGTWINYKVIELICKIYVNDNLTEYTQHSKLS